EAGEVMTAPAGGAATVAVTADQRRTADRSAREGAVPSAARPSRSERIFASPRARMRARAVGMDLSSGHRTGPPGRIVEADVLSAAPSDARVVATPLARRLAQEHGVVIGDLRGTGPGGRVTQEDVQRATEGRDEGQPGVVPLSRIRRITAER